MREEDRFTLGLTVVALILVSVLMIVESPEGEVVTEYEGREVAREFVKGSPTYQFDGYDLKYEEALYPDVAGCKRCYIFVFKFKSRHAGYGNRTGQMLAQVITPHEAHVTVVGGNVPSANLDGKWDMLKQKTKGKVGKEFCGWSTEENCSSNSDCITAGCSEQVCDSTSGESVVTTCEWKECYNADRYGLECKCVQGQCQWN